MTAKIPRTSIWPLDLRDISMIMSAPESRVPVKTFVTEWHNSVVKGIDTQRVGSRWADIESIHNKIENITAYESIQDIFPDIKLEIAHGQMKEGNLEKIMMSFNNFESLISTSIIERLD